jgi:cell division protein FtsB
MHDIRNPNWHSRGESDTVPRSNMNPPPQPDVDGRIEGMAEPVQRRRSPRIRRTRSSSSSRRKIRRLRLLAALLAAGLVVSAMLAVMLSFHVNRLSRNEAQLRGAQQQLEGELAQANARITELTNDVRILLANRVPGIEELVFARQIELNDQYVKNITFVQSGLGNERTVEFSAVLHNGRTGPVLPRVTIVLFDEVGLQTGIARLDKSQTTTPADIPELQPGETRTYSAPIDLSRQTPSKYFVVEVR